MLEIRMVFGLSYLGYQTGSTEGLTGQFIAMQDSAVELVAGKSTSNPPTHLKIKKNGAKLCVVL